MSKKNPTPSKRRVRALIKHYKASIDSLDWASEPVQSSVLAGVTNALLNARPGVGLVIPPVAEVWHNGEQWASELCHVPSALQGKDLVDYLGDLGSEHQADWVSFNYVSGDGARDLIVTFVLFPALLWKVTSFLDGATYVRVDVECREPEEGSPPLGESPPTFAPHAKIHCAWVARGSEREVLLAVWQAPGEALLSVGSVREAADGSRQWIFQTVAEETVASAVENGNTLMTALIEHEKLGERGAYRCIKDASVQDLRRWVATLEAEGFTTTRAFDDWHGLE